MLHGGTKNSSTIFSKNHARDIKILYLRLSTEIETASVLSDNENHINEFVKVIWKTRQEMSNKIIRIK